MEELIKRNETNLYKAVAILIIIVSHIGRYLGISIVKPLGAVGVAIFLVISGYGLNESYKRNGNKKFISKRFIKVLIPYIIVLIVFALVYKINIKDFLEFLVLINVPNGMYWYIKYIVLIYVFFYITTFINDNKNRFFCLGTIILIFTLLNLSIRNYIWQIFSFMLGILLSDNQEKFKNIIKNNKYFIVFIVITIISVILKKMPYVEERETGVIDTILQILITFCLSNSIMIFIARFSNIFNLKIFNLIGAVSYEVYLTHVHFFDIMKDKSIKSIVIYVVIVVILTSILHILNIIINKLIIKGEKKCNERKNQSITCN